MTDPKYNTKAVKELREKMADTLFLRTDLGAMAVRKVIILVLEVLDETGHLSKDKPDLGIKEELSDSVKAQGQNTLLPCPFCGSDADHHEMHSFERRVTQFCIGCQAYGPSGYTTDEARERWNTRSKPLPHLGGAQHNEE